jgi:undecaprenyl diphosphate synthase
MKSIHPELLANIDMARLPNHVAIIMDGNGRWAKLNNKPRIFGHRNGVRAVREASEAAAELGIGYLTLYAFSTENWNRPKVEVNALMTLLVHTLRNEVKTLNKNNIRLNAIGDIKRLPEKCYKELLEAINATASNDRMTLTLALNYSGRWELVQAAKKLATLVKLNEIEPDDIDEQIFMNQLATANIPDPELLIRTSGEFRISNFLLWQLAYTELAFIPKFWPEFRKEDFCQAVIDFQGRERRFGKTGEQIIKENSAG